MRGGGGVPSTTYSDMSSGVRRPLRGGDISNEKPCPLGDCGVPERDLGVVFLGGVLEIFALGKREKPPDCPFDAMLSDFYCSPQNVNSMSKRNDPRSMNPKVLRIVGCGIAFLVWNIEIAREDAASNFRNAVMGSQHQQTRTFRYSDK